MDSMTLVSTALQEVIPGLWIGDYQAARDARLLKANKITAVVSAMRQDYTAHPGVEVHRVYVDDTEQTNIIEHFLPCVDFIHSILEKKEGVLVHCQAGVSRSTTLVSAYLMVKQGLNVEQAVEKIQAVRNHVQPSEAFYMQLEMFERCNCEWNPAKWQEERRFLMSFAQAQIMEGASPSMVLAYYPSPDTAPEKLSAAPRSDASHAAAASLPPLDGDALPGLAAPPMRKRLTPRKEGEAEEEKKTAEIEKIGSKGDVVVVGRRIRCKMCRTELAGRDHIITHEPGIGQQAFRPGRRDMAAHRMEQEKFRRDSAEKAAVAAAGPDAPSYKPTPTPAAPQVALPAPANPLAALRISKPLAGLRISQPFRPPVARPQPMARPSSSSATPSAATPSSAADSSPSTPSSDFVTPSAPAPAPAAAIVATQTTDPGPPLLPSHVCSSYFTEPLSWMSGFLESGVLAGKIICPTKKCGAKLGNFDWAGSQCSCGAWVCPGFALSVSRVDEFVG